LRTNRAVAALAPIAASAAPAAWGARLCSHFGALRPAEVGAADCAGAAGAEGAAGAAGRAGAAGAAVVDAAAAGGGDAAGAGAAAAGVEVDFGVDGLGVDGLGVDDSGAIGLGAAAGSDFAFEEAAAAAPAPAAAAATGAAVSAAAGVVLAAEAEAALAPDGVDAPPVAGPSAGGRPAVRARRRWVSGNEAAASAIASSVRATAQDGVPGAPALARSIGRVAVTPVCALAPEPL
jgi:hypothetical protein